MKMYSRLFVWVICFVSTTELNSASYTKKLSVDGEFSHIYHHGFPKELIMGGEKVVYIGFGTSTSVDPWQSVPGFMVELMRNNIIQCRCINIDASYSSESMEVAWQHIKNQVSTQTIDQKRFLFIHSFFGETEHSTLYDYCKNILENGGVLCMANMAVVTEIPYAVLLYNDLSKLYPTQVIFLIYSNSVFGQRNFHKVPYYWREGYLAVWSKGVQFQYYDKELILDRFRARNKLLCEDGRENISQEYAFQWYAKHYLTEFSDAMIQPWTLWCTHYKPQRLEDRSCSMLQSASKKQMEEDFLTKPISIEIMPWKTLETATIDIDTSKDFYVFERIHAPGIPPFSLFDFTSPYAQNLRARCAMDSFVTDLRLLQVLGVPR